MNQYIFSSIGDLIKILKKSDDQWWEGEFKGKRGVFPSNYVRTPTPQEYKLQHAGL